jgi:hypothetical protein
MGAKKFASVKDFGPRKLSRRAGQSLFDTMLWLDYFLTLLSHNVFIDSSQPPGSLPLPIFTFASSLAP